MNSRSARQRPGVAGEAQPRADRAARVGGARPEGGHAAGGEDHGARRAAASGPPSRERAARPRSGRRPRSAARWRPPARARGCARRSRRAPTASRVMRRPVAAPPAWTIRRCRVAALQAEREVAVRGRRRSGRRAPGGRARARATPRRARGPRSRAPRRGRRRACPPHGAPASRRRPARRRSRPAPSSSRSGRAASGSRARRSRPPRRPRARRRGRRRRRRRRRRRCGEVPSKARRYRTGAACPVLPPPGVARARHRARPPRAGRTASARSRPSSRAATGSAGSPSRRPPPPRSSCCASTRASTSSRVRELQRARAAVRHGHAHQPRLLRGGAAGGGRRVRARRVAAVGRRAHRLLGAAPARATTPSRRTAMGFCLFANVAVAARHALDALGAERVLVLDWDVHHGNGTNAIFHASPEVLFASIHQSPFWPGTGPLEDVGEGDGRGLLDQPAGAGRDWRGGLPVARRARRGARRARSTGPT